MNYLNADFAVKLIKNISDNNRCYTCDKLNTSCVRYSCGHWKCGECFKIVEDCSLCTSTSNNITHIEDRQLNSRITHAYELVVAFQDLFNIDVNERLNSSRKLKEERQLFPKCIQAPKKYCNKRKTNNIFLKEQENRRPSFLLPGEQILITNDMKMDDKRNSVQKWIDNIALPEINQTPFTDLNGRKRTSKVKLGGFELIKKQKKNIESNDLWMKSNLNIYSYQTKCDNDESGIVLDDEAIEIANSETDITIDKDKLACLAVIKADLNKNKECNNISNDSLFIESSFPKISVKPHPVNPFKHKVPFYRKCFLYKSSSLHNICNVDCEDKKQINANAVFETKSFSMEIEVSGCNECATFSTVQNKISKSDNIKIIKKSQNIEDSTKFYECEAEETAIQFKKTKCQNFQNINSLKINLTTTSNPLIVIETSDTESNSTTDKKRVKNFEQVERSLGIKKSKALSQLEQNRIDCRPKRRRREQTPKSTDSSDKENFDPNRARKSKHSNKKYPVKKYLL